MTRQLVRFAAIGVVSTLVYLVLFLLLQPWRARSWRTSWHWR